MEMKASVTKQNRTGKCWWLLLMLAVLALTGCQKKLTVEKYLNLGSKYLLELNYDEAIVTFTKAIELEPKAMKAYEGLADAYIKTEAYEKADETIQSGIAVYDGLTEDERTEEVQEAYEALLKLQEEISLYCNAENDADKETETSEAETEKDFSEYQETIDSLFAVVSSGDRESIWQRQSADDYQSFISGLDCVFTQDCGDGNWFRIYPCGHCYYGGMEDGKRSGHGIWCAYDYVWGEMTFASCEWRDDYPNGDGEAWSRCIPVPEDLFYDKMSLQDGLYHGTVYSEESTEGEDYIWSYSYTCNEGAAVEVQDLHPEMLDEYYHEENMYCIYSDADKSDYAERGSVCGIDHAGKGKDAEKSMKPYTASEIQAAKESAAAEHQEWEVVKDRAYDEG